jgi:hypothetical protein
MLLSQGWCLCAVSEKLEERLNGQGYGGGIGIYTAFSLSPSSLLYFLQCGVIFTKNDVRLLDDCVSAFAIQKS